jgi:hypothetical protein
LTSSRSSALLGKQTPQFELVPRAKSSAAPEVIDLCASHGLVLEPHQQHVLHGALGENPDPKRPGQWRWAAFEVGVLEPRQNGKGGLITARELGGLYLFREPLQTHTAHRFDTCLEGFRRIREIIDGYADLSKRVKRISDSHGQESIELYCDSKRQRLTGPTQRLNFKARSKGSGRGFSGDVVYLDEAFWLMELGSLLPTMSARPNPQLWYLSSHPLPRVESEVLRRLCKRGRGGVRKKSRPRRLAYFDWCASLPKTKDRAEWDKAVAAVLDDRRAWAEANPGLGYRLTADFMQSERDAMTDEEFARERLGLYPETEEALPPVIPPASWAACRSEATANAPASVIVKPVVYAFEVSMDRKWGVIAAAGRSSIDGTHVEIGDNRPGTGWVVERLVELRDKHQPTAIVCNPTGPAGGLLADCEAAGLKIGIPTGTTAKDEPKHRSVTSTDYAQACAAALDAITEHRWQHLGQGELDKAVAGAAKRITGDTWVFDRRGGLDISPLVAVTLAAWVASKPVQEPAKEADFILI